MNIEELKIEEQALAKRLNENREMQRTINTAEFVKKWGVDIGDTVEWTEGSGKRSGVISRIESWSTTPSYFHAFLFNADGKLGKREVRIYGNSLKLIKKNNL